MALTLASSIADARTVLNDESSVAYTDADLLLYANDALDAILRLAPFWFLTTGTVSCTAGTTEQSLSFANAHALDRVVRVVGGNAVFLAERETLERFNPAWRTDTAGAAVNWMPVTSDPVHFDIYPQAPANQVLEVVYIRVPGQYAAADDTGLPMTLGPAITDYIVGMAMSRDDESVNANRAQMFLQSFTARVSGAQQ